MKYDAGRLLGFDVQPDGDVMLEVSDIEDNYVHHVLITYAELQGIAEAAKTRRQENDNEL